MEEMTHESFVYAERREVWWPVVINVPYDGGPRPVKVEFLYALLKRSEAAEMEKLGDEEFLARLKLRIRGWRGFVTPDKQALPFTPEILNSLLEEPYVSVAAYRGLVAASHGAAVKNL